MAVAVAEDVAVAVAVACCGPENSPPRKMDVVKAPQHTTLTVSRAHPVFSITATWIISKQGINNLLLKVNVYFRLTPVLSKGTVLLRLEYSEILSRI